MTDPVDTFIDDLDHLIESIEAPGRKLYLSENPDKDWNALTDDEKESWIDKAWEENA